MKPPRATALWVTALLCLPPSSGCQPSEQHTPAPPAQATGPRVSNAPSGTDATADELSVTGYRVIGERIDTSLPERWLGERVHISGESAAKATLVRFWTDTCPYCARSLPMIETLRERFGSEGFEAIGVYHPKPARDVADAEVAAAAARLGFTGPVAIDADWSSLRSIWLDDARGSRRATSASFLVDAQGVVRFVHPGPEFVGDDLEHVERAIRELLAAE